MTVARDIEQRAAEWLMRREEPEWSTADEAVLAAWLEESLAHKAAFWRLEHGWRQADRIGALGLDAHRPLVPRNWIASWRPFAAAASLLAVLITGAIELEHPAAVTPTATFHFATPIGGRRTIPLADGSKVELNTATVVRASMSDKRRDVWLDKGEAYFEVAHLGGRPFVVHAGNRTVTVVGTKFSVRRDGDRVTVAVIEGRVEIDDAAQPDKVPTAVISAGDVAISQGPSTLLSAKSEERVAAALGWREGILNFDHTSLTDAAAEFNRYNSKQIVIADAEAGEIRIGGTFQASNVEAFVRLLHDAYGLRVTATSNQVKLSS
jgi:transmembrane sensor